MARIRSVHPEQWTDEDFVCLSFPARLLAIAIRNECDDKGVFEWKPQRIKMRLFPADNVDVADLLKELVDCDQVCAFDEGGKRYGAVRNFRKYQRPKKPNDVYPLPHELRKYVGLADESSELEADEDDEVSPPVPHQFPTSSEIAPQMEDGGCRMESNTPLNPPKGKRATQISPDAQITPGMIRAGEKRGHSSREIAAQFERFKTSAIAKGRKYVNWDAAFGTWLDSPYFKAVHAKDGAGADQWL